jgi:hypothetical protein
MVLNKLNYILLGIIILVIAYTTNTPVTNFINKLFNAGKKVDPLPPIPTEAEVKTTIPNTPLTLSINAKNVNNDKVLKKGMKCDEVKLLQGHLNIYTLQTKLPNLPITGYFGSKTETALLTLFAVKEISLNGFTNKSYAAIIK